VLEIIYSMKVKVVLRGANDEIYELQRLLEGSLWYIVEESGEYFLLSKKLELLKSNREVLEYAQRFLKTVNGVLNSINGSSKRIWVYEIRRIIDEKRTAIHTEYPLTLRIRKIQEVDKEFAHEFIEKSFQDDSIKHVVNFMTDISWWNMYKVYEVIRKDVGGQNRIKRIVSNRELKRFTQTAQSIETLGDEARHADPVKYRAPHDPMSKNEAIEFIREMISSWIKEYK
jgi:hypothetical protein